MCLNRFARGEWTQEINSELINTYYLKIDENLHISSKDWNHSFGLYMWVVPVIKKLLNDLL